MGLETWSYFHPDFESQRSPWNPQWDLGTLRIRVNVVQQNKCHPAGWVLSSSLPLTLTLPSGETDDTNEGRLHVSWHQSHTLLPLFYTVSFPPTLNHRHNSLYKQRFIWFLWLISDHEFFVKSWPVDTELQFPFENCKTRRHKNSAEIILYFRAHVIRVN